ncbi:MAG: glycosyltransferase [Allorhizobium sp.]
MIYYDLTELYYLSRGSIKFYGIARVVAEIAYEISTLAPDTVFVVHDESRQRFFRVDPVLGQASGNGLISLAIHGSAIPAPLHTLRDGASPLKKAAIRLANGWRRFFDRKRLASWPDSMTPIDLQAGVLFSAARPKAIARIVDHLRQSAEPVRLAVLLHDAIPLHGKNGRLGRNARHFRDDTAKTIAQADRIIANSKFTLADLLDFGGNGVLPPLPPNPAVVPLAHECRGAKDDRTFAMPDRPFILGVGMSLGRKNLDTVLRAQEILLARGKTPPLLVLAGTQRPRMIRKLEADFPTFAEHVLLIDSAPQSQLIGLYRHALASVMASHLEGWGLPAGESLWLGTPIILANASSLPEVGGDLACYFDPQKPEDLADILTRFQSDPIMVAALKAKIATAHPALRSWRTVASDLVDVLREEDALASGTGNSTS